MRRRLSIAMGLFFSILLMMPLVTAAEAQQKEGKGATVKEDRLDGTVHMMDKAAKTITVRLRGKTIQREVVYSDSTKFTFRNKPGSLDDIKDGRRVIVLGKVNDKNQLIATRIDIRDSM